MLWLVLSHLFQCVYAYPRFSHSCAYPSVPQSLTLWGRGNRTQLLELWERTHSCRDESLWSAGPLSTHSTPSLPVLTVSPGESERLFPSPPWSLSGAPQASALRVEGLFVFISGLLCPFVSLPDSNLR